MVTDQQYKDALARIKILEEKVDAIGRNLTELLMSADVNDIKPKTPQEFPNRRDVTKYKYFGELYNKRGIVLAVVKQHVKDNPNMSAKDLQDTFPDYIQGSLGVIRRVEDAEIYRDSTTRYYFGDEDIIHSSDGNLVVSKDWSTKNINRFINHVKNLGYDIRIIERE